MDKAARISPLALCLVKPPAPELLHSMPVRDQRQLLADWAEATNLASTLTPLFTATKKTPKPAARDEGIYVTYLFGSDTFEYSVYSVYMLYDRIFAR